MGEIRGLGAKPPAGPGAEPLLGLVAKHPKKGSLGQSANVCAYLKVNIATYSARIFRPHRQHAVHRIRPIATDVAHIVVCVFVCLCVGHMGVLCD